MKFQKNIPTSVWEIAFRGQNPLAGLYNKQINERFYVRTTGRGRAAATDPPHVRHNLIKRIGDYKMAMIQKVGP